MRTNHNRDKFNCHIWHCSSTWNLHKLSNSGGKMSLVFSIAGVLSICLGRKASHLTAKPPIQNRSILRSLERCELIWNLLSLAHCFLSMKNSLSNGAFQTYNSSENRISDTNTRAGLSLDRPTSECHYLYNGLMKLGADKGGWKFN